MLHKKNGQVCLLGVMNLQKKINQDRDVDTTECYGGQICEQVMTLLNFSDRIFDEKW